LREVDGLGDVFQPILGWAILLGLIVSPYFIIKGLRAADRRAAERNQARLAAEHERTKVGVPGKPERRFLKACTNCGAFALTLPYSDTLGRTYCSEACASWLGDGPRTFCKKCTFETTAEASGNLHTINGIGTRFVGSADRCSECASVLRRVWITFFFLPIAPLKKYRVIQISPHEFLSRSLRN
jgi:hypothetical protein